MLFFLKKKKTFQKLITTLSHSFNLVNKTSYWSLKVHRKLKTFAGKKSKQWELMGIKGQTGSCSLIYSFSGQ